MDIKKQMGQVDDYLKLAERLHNVASGQEKDILVIDVKHTLQGVDATIFKVLLNAAHNQQGLIKLIFKSGLAELFKTAIFNDCKLKIDD